MKKSMLFIAAAVCAAGVSKGGEYTTPEGTVDYTFAILAGIDGSGVTASGTEGEYVLDGTLTITAPNTFSLAGANTLLMKDDARLCIECRADLRADGRFTVTRASESDAPAGWVIDYEGAEPTEIANLDFAYAQLRNSAPVGFNMADCTFSNANGKLTSSGAVTLGTTGACFNITGCTFTDNEVPGIGGAANYYCGINITDCTFINNNTQNTNKPQLNLTVGGALPVNITGCTLQGAGLDKVGGIAVGNLMAAAGENLVTITGCTITDHRYGMTGIGPMKMIIRDNVMIDNNHETNPMNGGSGISLAGYNYGLDAILSGNTIKNSLWGVTLIGCRDVNLGEVGNADSPGNNVFSGNGNNGVLYDLYNNQAANVYAQNNTWGVEEQTAEQIATVIYDHSDDPALGEVFYMPAAETTGIASAISAKGIRYENGRILSDTAVEIYDASGRLVVPAGMNPDVKDLASGIYIARSGKASLVFAE